MMAALSEEVLARGRVLTERLETVGEVLTEALREENRAIKELQNAKAGESGRREKMVQHILLRKILSVDRGDSGKLLRGVRALMESVVTIALSVRADGLEGQPADSPDSNSGSGATTALTLVGGQLDVAEQRLGKIELRAGQLQLIGGPRLNEVDSDDSDEDVGKEGAAAGGADGAEAGEAAALTALAEQPAAGMSRERLLSLGTMVAEMRTLESSVEFHTALLSAHRKLAAERPPPVSGARATAEAGDQQQLQYSRTNFSYGSTPHSSWLALFEQCAPLRAAVGDMLSLRGVPEAVDEYCVFGSSLGWLCFYGCLTFGAKNGSSFFEFSLCLSRACLGKIIVLCI